MESISIQVDSEIAQVYQGFSLIERQKIQIIVNGWLKQMMKKRSLDEIIDDMRSQAQENGLTQEVLDEILSEDV
ncbi:MULTISPECIES: hypothetical protein [unclassified Roseofilum]|uniref:hypothetical protein n=1 Tax=unclassified Roseofilum TaxID=2620099 RepID=UPI000E7D3AB5|nr:MULTISPECIES: hypothetical protein [unclassified Roseofilum]MBP0010043.1 hypothetical protein [Roseofilum sp. Belize Diploria]MBP0035827.1 hypothetical protein [Roseofilum sp. Belize BBD 4]HBQ99970.1 hypothetical protein [Cyanobacteria bacterium UBA11691]